MTTPITPHDTHDTFVIEGVITELQVAPDSENLLAQIRARCQAGSAATGRGALPDEFHDRVAAAAKVALYAGEDTETFACLIDGNVLYGTFGGASKLPVGQKVKTVVAQHGEVLLAHGILSEELGLVWVPYVRGSEAERASIFKLASWCFGFAMACVTACTFVMDVDTGMGKLETLMWGAIVTGVLCFGMAFWDASMTDTLPDPATDIFRKLGFADPERVNLNNYQYGIVHSHALVHSPDTRANHGSIHCYKKAIEDGQLKLAQ